MKARGEKKREGERERERERERESLALHSYLIIFPNLFKNA